MSVHREPVRYGPAQEFSGLVMWPERAQLPLPAVIVIQEAWGLSAHIEDVVRRFALAGYVALAPDLYAKNGARPEALSAERLSELLAFVNSAGPAIWTDMGAREAALAKLPEDQRQRVGGSLGALFGGALSNLDVYVPNVVAAAKFLRSELAASKGQPVGSVGFCMGGAVSVRLAANDPELKASVIFYGDAPAADKIPNIQCPVLGLYGSVDPRLMAGLPDFKVAMKNAGKSFEVHVYEGAPHAFFNDTRPSYNVAAARDAYARVLSFFRQYLVG